MRISRLKLRSTPGTHVGTEGLKTKSCG